MNRIKKFLVFFFLLLTLSSLGFATTLERTGWNLIAVCEDINTSEIDLENIQEIQSQEGKSLYTGEYAEYSNLKELKAGYGYWVRGDEGNFFNSGSSSQRLERPLLHNDWNLMAACDDIPKEKIDMSHLFEIQEQNGHTLYTGVNAEYSNLDALRKGYGYWVNGNAETLFVSKAGLSIPVGLDFQAHNAEGNVTETTFNGYQVKIFSDANISVNPQDNHINLKVNINGEDVPDLLAIEGAYLESNIIVAIYDAEQTLVGLSEIVKLSDTLTIVPVVFDVGGDINPPVNHAPTISLSENNISIGEGVNIRRVVQFTTNDLDADSVTVGIDYAPSFVSFEDREIIIDINESNSVPIGQYYVNLYAADVHGARGYTSLLINIERVKHPELHIFDKLSIDINGSGSKYFSTKDVDSVILGNGTPDFVRLVELNNTYAPSSSQSIVDSKKFTSPHRSTDTANDTIWRTYRIDVNATAETPVGYYAIEVLGTNNELGVEVGDTLNLFYGIESPAVNLSQSYIDVNQGESRSIGFVSTHSDSIELGETVHLQGSNAYTVASFTSIHDNLIEITVPSDLGLGAYYVEVIAKNNLSGGEVSKWLGIHVDPEGSNHAPDLNITVLESVLAVNSTSRTIATAYASDIDGDDVNISLEYVPTFIVMNEHNISFVPDGTEREGVYFVSIVAEDSQGLKSYQWFSLELRETIQPIVGLKPLYTNSERLYYDIYGSSNSTLLVDGISSGIQLTDGSARVDFENNASKVVSLALEDENGTMSDVQTLSLSTYSNLNMNLNDNWSNKVLSTHRNGNSANSSSSKVLLKPVDGGETSQHYAKYYYFTIDSDRDVTIDLHSSVDTYMYLLSGLGKDATLLEQDDDSGDGFDSRIVRSLVAGTYTIEVTTFAYNQLGNFNLEITANNAIGINHAPSISLSDNNISLNAGIKARVVVEVNASDIDDDNITIGLENAPTFISLVNNEIIVDLNETNIFAGEYVTVVYAEDEHGAKSTVEFKVNILDDNSSLIVTPPPSSTNESNLSIEVRGQVGDEIYVNGVLIKTMESNGTNTIAIPLNIGHNELIVSLRHGGVEIASQTIHIDRVDATQKRELPLLIVRIEFDDYSFRSSENTWHSKIFGSSEGELNHYYNEISYGKFGFVEANETEGTVNDGIVTVHLNMNHPGDVDSFPNRINEAIALANNYIDFSQYDKNLNGAISIDELQLMYLVAGGESATGVNPGVWAYAWCMYGGNAIAPTHDGVKLMSCDDHGGFSRFGERHFDIDNGPDASVGIIAHELGHAVFELPDLYDYDNSSKGIGEFGLMGAGSWSKKAGDTYPGETPVHMTGWCKLQSGFVTPEVITQEVTNLELKATALSDFKLYKIPTSIATEYFLIENRAALGYDHGFDALVGSNGSFNGGLLITHIDESQKNNDNDSRRLVDVEEANNDSLKESHVNNLFFSGNSDAFTPLTTPNSNTNDGASTGISISNISDTGTSMSADISLNN